MRRAVAGCMLVVAALQGGCVSTPEEQGAAQARRDVERGVLAYRVRGWGVGMDWPYVLFVQERYGISIRQTGGCLVAVEDADFDDGYNRVSLSAIEARKGAGVLELARDEWRDLGVEGQRGYFDRVAAMIRREMENAKAR